jgi:hypothetical protein
MEGFMKNFGETAEQLARNPLGVVALFIVLVEAIAGLTIGLVGNALSVEQRWPLVWFLVLFPPFVFGVFAWLVAKHPGKLYGPADFKSDEGFFRSLTVSPTPSSSQNHDIPPIQEIVEGKVFGSEEVILDGKRFLRCEFKKTTLVFQAKQPVGFSDTTFHDVNWRLDGPAALTINFLIALRHSGDVGRILIDNTLKELFKDSQEDA